MPGSGKTRLAARLATERASFETLQWRQALQLMELGVSVIAESAGWRRESRERRRSAAAALGVRTELHVLDVPLAERWRRIERRNRDPRAVHVTREQLEGFEPFWEPPTAAERAAYDAVRVW